jgi:hypothetical protein
MENRPLLQLDELLCQGIASAESAAQRIPHNARNFRKILAMLWSARDELDLVVSHPKIEQASLQS